MSRALRMPQRPNYALRPAWMRGLPVFGQMDCECIGIPELAPGRYVELDQLSSAYEPEILCDLCAACGGQKRLPYIFEGGGGQSVNSITDLLQKENERYDSQTVPGFVQGTVVENNNPDFKGMVKVEFTVWGDREKYVRMGAAAFPVYRKRLWDVLCSGDR